MAQTVFFPIMIDETSGQKRIYDPNNGQVLSGADVCKRTESAAGAYAILPQDCYIAKTGITGGGDTLTLPAPATVSEGKMIIVKDESGTAGTNAITIDGN